MASSVSDRVSKQFIKGLEEYGMTKDDLDNWRYVGSCCDMKYWKVWFPNQIPPFHDDISLPCENDKNRPEYHCICGQKIFHRIYITFNGEFLIIGNECKDHFLKYKGKTCSQCKNPHKNSKNNLCNECRIKLKQKLLLEKKRKCRNCSKVINMGGTTYKYCYSCNVSRKLKSYK